MNTKYQSPFIKSPEEIELDLRSALIPKNEKEVKLNVVTTTITDSNYLMTDNNSNVSLNEN